jgi:hypothetical protein
MLTAVFGFAYKLVPFNGLGLGKRILVNSVLKL